MTFADSAFKHGYDEEDFFEALDREPMELRSLRGLAGLYELYGQNYAGDYLHIVYRREHGRTTVFHIRRMNQREKEYYRRRQ